MVSTATEAYSAPMTTDRRLALKSAPESPMDHVRHFSLMQVRRSCNARPIAPPDRRARRTPER